MRGEGGDAGGILSRVSEGLEESHDDFVGEGLEENHGERGARRESRRLCWRKFTATLFTVTLRVAMILLVATTCGRCEFGVSRCGRRRWLRREGGRE